LEEEGVGNVEGNLELGLEVDVRDYAVGARILKDLGITSMRLLTNNPAKYQCIAEHGLRISEKVALHTPATRENFPYLEAKRKRLGHTLLPSLSGSVV